VIARQSPRRVEPPLCPSCDQEVGTPADNELWTCSNCGGEYIYHDGILYPYEDLLEEEEVGRGE